MIAQMFKVATSVVLLNNLALAQDSQTAQVEVVLAHHSEDLSWLSSLPKDVHVKVYTKGPQMDLNMPSASRTSLQHLPNVGRESHTYLHHIVQNYEHLAKWTVFSQAGKPSFGYKGHRAGGGHLLAGDDFANYLTPHSSGSRFVYTSAVHLPSMNHLLRAAYCIDDAQLEGRSANMCPLEASQWTPWWDIGDFRKFVSSKVETQQGDKIMDFYRKYINPTHTGAEVVAPFPQGARFSLSRETIQRRPKADYQRLLAILSKDEDSYAGYFMEWLWSELFLGNRQPCSLPAQHSPVSHDEAINSLVQRFPKSVGRYSARMLSEAGVSGGISGGVSGGISGGISGGVSGGISGGISGGVSTSTLAPTATVKVAGTMEVEVDVQGNITQQVLEDIFKRAIANALNVSIEHVVKLEVSEIQNSSRLRRLQSVQRKRYEVSYEVIVPSSMDLDAVVQKANRIAVSGSTESQLFRQVLTASNGVAQVHQVLTKIAAHTVDDKINPVTQADRDDDKSWTALVVGGIAIVVVVALLITSAIVIKRKMAT